MNEEKKEETGADARRIGLLKKMIDHFSSTPIPDETGDSTINSRSSILTLEERDYLETLLQSGDLNSIEAASQRLSDTNIFPPDDDILQESSNNERPSLRRRDSHVQQQLFRLHETSSVVPSHLVSRMSLVHRNSILESEESAWALDASESLAPTTAEGDETDDAVTEWNPFKDISSWIDGSQGVEVNDEGTPLERTSKKVKIPFKILGTAADDVSCHPHVLSPPLMESLLAFVPESVSDCNFWLKYSLVRDGGSLWHLLRNVRASTNVFLAIETVEGHVFGSFTSQAWRLSQGWYGSSESFLWKMRQSRLASRSIVDQVCEESEIQVYPYRTGNVAVQHCAKDSIMLGQGELLPADKPGMHYGHALCLDASLQWGTTSTSETFGNPCLVDDGQRGARFEVSNLEVWALTPHTTVGKARQSELSALFLEGGREEGSLSFMNILVGGPI